MPKVKIVDQLSLDGHFAAADDELPADADC
jgi:hypothetical protein